MKRLYWKLFAFASTLFVALPAFAEGPEVEAAAEAAVHAGPTAAIAAAFAISIAAFGGALAQGRAAAAALEGIARNPQAQDKIFTPMILGLALIESLVIYALIIAFMLVGKI